jgi:hypothetical protein
MKITKLQKEWMADRFEVYGYDEILRTYGYEVEDDTWDTHNGYCPEKEFGYVPSKEEFYRTFDEVAKWIKEKEFPTQVTTLQMYVVEDCIEWAELRYQVYEEAIEYGEVDKPAGSFKCSYKNLEKKFDSWKEVSCNENS